MALKLTQREVDGVTVVALDGRIVLGEESNALREKVKSLLADGKKKIVLNMDNITFIDSAGLGTLVASHHTAKKEGASLRLCHLGSKFQEVLQITKLLTVFEVYDTEAGGVQLLPINSFCLRQDFVEEARHRASLFFCCRVFVSAKNPKGRGDRS